MVCLTWSPTLEFIGNVFDLCGHSGRSAEHRQHKANGVFRRLGTSSHTSAAPTPARMKAFRVPVASSALWLAGCWTLVKTQASLVRGLLACCVVWSPAGGSLADSS